MERGAWILMPMAYYMIALIVWFAVEGGHGCSVTPSAVAVIAGNSVSLTCASTDTVNAWKRGSDYIGSSIVYRAPFGTNNNITRIVVDGYFVDDSVNLQAILIMNSTSTVQADRYYCNCYVSPSNAASVTVLVSKPTFSTTNQITDGGPVNITCSISFNGTADASLTITDISGTKVANKSEVGTYPSTSTDLRVINLDYNTTANSSVNQTYFCQVNLTDNSKTIYSEPMVTSLHWVSVRNVQINPVDKMRCSNNSQCAINQTLNCTAEGNPYPDLFQWTGFLNGSSFSKNSSGLLTLTSTGNYRVKCTAFNMIGDMTYNSTSEYFLTEVTFEGPPTPLPDTQKFESKTGLIVGLVVGLGCALILVTIIVVFVLCKRKKSRTVCCNPDDKETRSNQAVELSKQHNGNNSFNTDNGVQNKSFVKSGNDEVTLVDNDLYGKQSKTQIDPSDGGYASVNEVMQQSK